MERILTAAQMRDADKFTIEKLGVSEDELVSRAGLCVADEIMKRFHGGRVLVCVGKGKNGADGKIIANILAKKHGFTVSIVSVYNGIFKMFDCKYDIIVDCILGTGLNRPVDGYYKTAIEKINESSAFVVSCDIPSGLNGDNGRVMGVAVKANLTVAIQEYKLGHFLNEGPDYSGEVVARDIGISIWGDDYVKRLTPEAVSKFFKHRPRNINKGTCGRVALIGGSKQYSGSALLALNALTALKAGTGYSNLIVPESLFYVYAGRHPECLITTAKEKDGVILYDEELLRRILTYNSIAIGMGIGVSKEVFKTICFLLENYKGHLLIDADGLNSLAKYGIDVLKNKKCKVVLTPHVGEFARLCKVEKETVLEDFIGLAKDFAKEHDVIVVLKSAVSIITDGEEVYINTTGCNGMAKAGTGDVLSGFAVGMLANTEDVLECSAAACFVLGKAGEITCKEQNEFTMTASDIIKSLPKVINKL